MALLTQAIAVWRRLVNFSGDDYKDHNNNSDGSAALDVLTQPQLLAHVTSFQRGLPSCVTGPLIARYVRATVASDHDDTASHTMAFATVGDVWGCSSLQAAQRLWRALQSLEILMKKLDSDNTRRVCSHVHCAMRNSHSSRQRILHHARATATAVGRQDVLTWLGKTYTAEYMTTPSLRVASSVTWHRRVIAEAIAAYDNDTLDALRFVVCSATSQRQPRPEQTRCRVVQCVWKAAAAFGRVDILTWLYATQRYALVSLPALARLAASQAVRHGHVTVLTWLETTMGDMAPFSAIATVNLKPAVRFGRLELVRWMAQRSLGVVPVGAAYVAVTHRRLDMLREVMHFPSPFEPTESTVDASTRFEPQQRYALAKYAAFTAAVTGRSRRDPWGATMEALVEADCPFPIELLQSAIERRDLPAIQCMLDHLHNAVVERNAQSPAKWIVHRLIDANDVAILELLATTADRPALRRALGMSVLLWPSHAASSRTVVELLVCVSTADEIASVLLCHALSSDVVRFETVLELATGIDRPLPVDVVDFAQRVIGETLGPLASLAHSYRGFLYDAHVLETMTHYVTSAFVAREDVRDTVLRLVVAGRLEAARCILLADAARVDGIENADGAAIYCDVAFVRLCHSLRPSVERCSYRGVTLLI